MVFETKEEYSPEKLDSLDIQHFLDRNVEDSVHADAVRSFYERRDHQFAWFIKDSLSLSARSFLSLVNSGDTIHKAVAALRDQINELMKSPNEKSKVDIEVALTSKFFEVASKKYGGISRDEAKNLEWYIPRRKKNYHKLLDSLAAGKMDLSVVEPMHPQYFHLKEMLKAYHALLPLPWQPLDLGTRKKVEPGDSSPLVPEVRTRLVQLGDLVLPEGDTLAHHQGYDSTTVLAVKGFQQRHGLLVDGIIGSGVISELNSTPAERLRTILVNMERLRWMPDEDPVDLLLVNIPEFKLHVYEGEDIRMSMDVVVGKAANKTVVFSDTITYLVFSPTWTIPQSIIQEEILPAMKKDKNYLKKRNMEVIGGTSSAPVIQQNPGAGNSLGRVKFMFPNSYSIYLHDTPAKSLFDQHKRAFSHGCIRVARPTELAEYLLRNDTAWTPQKIDDAMHAGEEVNVSLKDPRPVMITYFTAWVDTEGRLQFREDIYAHDERLAREIFATDDPVKAIEEKLIDQVPNR